MSKEIKIPYHNGYFLIYVIASIFAEKTVQIYKTREFVKLIP